MKKTQKNTALGMALGMCFGVAISCAMGKSIALGMPIGMMLGMAIGAAKDKAVNEQLESKGYTVKDAVQTEDGFSVTVTDKDGNEQTFAVSAETMQEEDFRPGDAVYLSEDGTLTQAFDKEDAD